MQGRWNGWLLFAALQFSLPPCVAAAAGPYHPARDDEVLDTLPRDFLASRSEISLIRQQLAENPRDIRVASLAAARYLALGQQLADPRYYGYAQAAIDLWWDLAHPPAEILRVRAKLKERDHRYDDAIDDLQQLIEAEPENAQAWIEMANIYRVQGRLERARQACDELARFAGRETIQICEIPLLASTGKAEEAYQQLGELLPKVRRQWPDALPWVVATQAEIARALGLDRKAERHYLAGLDRDADDYYLLRGYADLLLDDNRPGEALALLRDHTADTGVLLRAAIAARRSGDERLAESLKQQLHRRFVETRLRDGQPHGRYEARFFLELKDDPQRALRIAIQNWSRQKEHRDTRNLLEAAIAAGNPAAAAPVIEFLDRYENDDRVLLELRRRLEQP